MEQGGEEQSVENGCRYSPNENISFKKKLMNHDFRRKFWRTIWIGASFCGLGFSVGQQGPAFLDLQIVTQTDVEAASFFFMSSSVGYLVGSVVVGVVYDKFNKSLLLLLCVLGMGVTTIVIPWCSIYGLMVAIYFIVSVFGGGIDTAGNAELVRIWGNEGETAMQSTHFAFAFGAVISPLITEPFLTPIPQDELKDSATINSFAPNITSSMLNTLATGEISSVTVTSSTPALPLTTIVHYAFLISGSIILLGTVPLAVQLFTERSEKRKQDHADKKKEVKQPLPTSLFLFVLSHFCIFYFLYSAVEDTFSAYLSTFVVKQLVWSKSNGASLTSVFWASFAAGRFLCIFVVQILKSVQLLFGLCVSLVFSVFAFLLLSQYCVSKGVWIATVMIGVSMSALFPSGFSWMEEEFLRVKGRVALSIMIASSSGTMVNPIVLGYMMEELTPMWFPYLLFGQSVLCLCLYLFLLVLARLYIKKHYVMHETKTEEIIVPSLAVEQSEPESFDDVRHVQVNMNMTTMVYR